MTLDQARAILAAPERAPHQGDWVLAGQILYRHWKDHPETLRRVDGGTLTQDAAPRRSVTTRERERITNRIAGLKSSLDYLTWAMRRRVVDSALTRDAASPTRKLLKLNGPASSYRIASDSDGKVWLEEFAGAQTARNLEDPGPDLMHADPARRMPGAAVGEAGNTGVPSAIPTGDAIARYKRTQAARNAGAQFAEEQNARMRQHWGQ